MICFVPHCAHYTETHNCKLFRFPKDQKIRAKWIKAIRRKDREPVDSSRVCSCHFRDGIKENGPSIFPWNESKLFTCSSPAKKRPRKSKNNTLQDTIEAESNYCPHPDIIYGETTKSTQTINSVLLEAELTLLRSKLNQTVTELENLKKRPFSFLCISDHEFLINYTGISKQAFLSIADLCSEINFKYF